MKKIAVKGGNQLNGTLTISGSKNAAVAILPAVILSDGVCRIEKLPDIDDVNRMISILEKLGAKVSRISRSVVEIDATTINTTAADFDEVRKMRASCYLVGALLGKFHAAEVAMPGGCNFGKRPIDLHLKGFSILGSDCTVVQVNADGTREIIGSDDGEVDYRNSDSGESTEPACPPAADSQASACDQTEQDVTHSYIIQAEAQKLVGDRIFLDKISVGATINIMLAAVKSEGKTIIDNAAKEPHVVDVANFLVSMGADIKGAGTDTIKINGVGYLKGTTYSIIPDQIEAGTYMAAVAAAGGDVLMKNVVPEHLASITAKLREAGAVIDEYDDTLRVRSDGNVHHTVVLTAPHPGFPTDMQPQIVALLSKAGGTSKVIEGVWNDRFQYLDEMRKMGVDVTVDQSAALVTGVKSLHGAEVSATDLRAGAALLIAALTAEGTTFITNVQYIERGYEDYVEKLSALGAEIEAIYVPDPVKTDAQTA